LHSKGKEFNSGNRVDYIEVEVLAPAAKVPKKEELDPLIKLVSRLLDTIFRIPNTRIRFGLAPVVGLIPILGIQATSLISAALLYRSVRHRLPKIAIVRMALNILITGIIGMIPVIGDIFVLLYKPNIRNYRILERYAGRTNIVTDGDWLFVSVLIGTTFFLIVVTTVLLVYATVSQFRWW
jgi:Domain of unknown function (DUF4112)